MSQEYERSPGRRVQGRRYTPSHLQSGGETRRRTSSASGSRSTASSRTTPPSRDSGPSRPNRPRGKRKGRFGPYGAMLYVIFVIGISALLAAFGWVAACDVLALNKPEHAATVTIEENTSLDQVADTLKDNGLIEYKFLFKLFASFTGAEKDNKITAGTYELDTDMDYHALISNMGKGSSSRKEVTVTITEGMTLDQIFALLEKEGVSTAAKLQEEAANHQFKYSFLKDLPTGDYHRLEGYLFPDTYTFYMGGDPLQILNKMILRFDEMFTDEMRQDAADRGYTVGEIVTIASMIEKETDGTDQTKIASVIYNRLENPTSETAGYLNIDATILYATGGTVVDTNADTPYNTSTHKGLPPTAISCPGIDALRAALYPADTNYYYYALGDDGTHSFFKTYKEHQRFIASQERYQTSQ
ncbi:endolytic transglycosylase MltG [Pseudoflavonifractor hominis]|uniref:Endolytic murein transglycosylase n=1 Tax=Pseudoflavonifractor hominis TaxID=2763059 RepID=A0ABR7HS97_9FIRM|nr:endolytic transglycosylase MltG [Pseudoflavonifractor hominis]MBC5730393.1 endolytic transglycosylase MltG [Pseudoflavonifractor hominis]